MRRTRCEKSLTDNLRTTTTCEMMWGLQYRPHDVNIIFSLGRGLMIKTNPSVIGTVMILTRIMEFRVERKNVRFLSKATFSLFHQRERRIELSAIRLKVPILLPSFSLICRSSTLDQNPAFGVVGMAAKMRNEFEKRKHNRISLSRCSARLPMWLPMPTAPTAH